MILAVEWNGDNMTTMKFAGLVMCLIGVSGHVWKKYTSTTLIENRYGIIGCEDNKNLTLPGSDSDDSDDSNSSADVLFDVLNRRQS